MRAKIIGFIGVLIYRLLASTWRVTVHETSAIKDLVENNSSFAIAHWHGDELGILFLLRRYQVACMISQSEDGSIMAQAVKLMGGEVVRGSSTRGGTSGLRNLLRVSRAGYRPSLAVDGPKGPIYKVKPGIFEISKALQLPIAPISVACDRAWRFEKSWNKTFLPKPFARLCVVWGHLMAPISKEDDPRSSDLAQSLESLLFDAKRQAERET